MNIKKVFFVDIETVRTHNLFSELNEVEQALFVKTFKDEMPFGSTDDHKQKVYCDKAALYAQFSKIVCISLGFATDSGFHVKPFAGRDELKILQSFIDAVDKSDIDFLVAHNGLKFDFSYIPKRCIINNLKIPSILDSFQKKPWEMRLLDTTTIWSGTAFEARTSLETLAYCLGLPMPKEEFDWQKVAEEYHSGSDKLPGTVKYCNGDVVTLANIFYSMRGLKTIPEDKIKFYA